MQLMSSRKCLEAAGTTKLSGESTIMTALSVTCTKRTGTGDQRSGTLSGELQVPTTLKHFAITVKRGVTLGVAFLQGKAQKLSLDVQT
jgi:hypothetical protein